MERLLIDRMRNRVLTLSLITSVFLGAQAPLHAATKHTQPVKGATQLARHGSKPRSNASAAKKRPARKGEHRATPEKHAPVKKTARPTAR
jgi:hypothetical protein